MSLNRLIENGDHIALKILSELHVRIISGLMTLTSYLFLVDCIHNGTPARQVANHPQHMRTALYPQLSSW
jgi:hypothetical protein